MTIVLLPGMDGTGVLFTPFVKALPPKYRVKIIRYPPDIPLRYDQLATRVRMELPETEPYIIIAESYSGPIALSLAAQPEGDLRAVVLAASFANSPHGRLGKWLAHLPWSFLFRFPAPLFILRRLLLNGSAPLALVTQLQEAIARVRPDILAMRLREVMSVDRSKELASLSRPIVWLVADNDRLLSRWNARFFARTHANTEMITIPGPHLILQCAPKECIAALARNDVLTR